MSQDTSPSQPEPKGEYLAYGGQAVIEGVMMRSPRFFSVACRAPDGAIVRKTERIDATWIGRQHWLKLPFLRGGLALLDSMALGVRAMKFASKVQMEGEQSAPKGRMQDAMVGGTIIVSIGLGLFLFQFAPNYITEFLAQRVGSPTARNMIAEGIKFVFLLGYIIAISRLKEIQEVFKYHGAEHKAINCFENRLPLTVENCAAQTRLHPRCGTSFIIVVALVSFFVLSPVPRYPLGEDANKFLNTIVRFAVELPFLPIISGIAYELIRFAGKFRHSGFVNILFAPGLATQLITTIEPRNDQIEVAKAALDAVIAAEARGDISPEDDILGKDPEPVLV